MKRKTDDVLSLEIKARARGKTRRPPALRLFLDDDEIIRMCGNSVCPPLASAIVRAQFMEAA